MLHRSIPHCSMRLLQRSTVAPADPI